MAYSDFTLERIQNDFGITSKITSLFQNNNPMSISHALKDDFELVERIPKRSEKAKSELIIVPILLELIRNNKGFLTFHSGEQLNVDKKKGLVGECDFILTKDNQSYIINLPILSVLEAKKDDLELGVAQCAAQLIGARIYNEKAGIALPILYGCVTNSREWQFIRLKDSLIEVHDKVYYLSEIEAIIGVFQQIIDFYKEILN
jgi:hypothetical protein